jgi:hypothetical protein
MKLNYSDFDSKIFKRKWYRLDLSDEENIDIEKIANIISESDAEYIDTKIIDKQSHFERPLKELGFRKTCMQIKMCCDLFKQNVDPESVTTYHPAALNEKLINKYSKDNCSSFTTSRFYLDEKLELSQVFEFQRTWLKNSLSNPEILKFIYSNSFLTIKQNNQKITTDLIAVPVEDRNKGIGTKLFLDAVGHSKKLGCKEMWATISSENISSFRMHTKVGFEIKSFTPCLHLDVTDLKK